jgi:hypothetical protein
MEGHLGKTPLLTCRRSNLHEKAQLSRNLQSPLGFLIALFALQIQWLCLLHSVLSNSKGNF